MQPFSPERLRGIAADIWIERKRLQRLADDIAFVQGARTIPGMPGCSTKISRLNYTISTPAASACFKR